MTEEGKYTEQKLSDLILNDSGENILSRVNKVIGEGAALSEMLAVISPVSLP